jgi:hypothetical protein
MFGLASVASAERAIPFQGRATGAITAATPGTLGLTIEATATGAATRLGEFTRQEVLLLDPTTNTFAGLVVFTVASGDRLIGQVTGGFVGPTTATGRYTFVGGTGRFAGVAGKAAFSLESSDGVNFVVEFRGRLEGLGR